MRESVEGILDELGERRRGAFLLSLFTLGTGFVGRLVGLLLLRLFLLLLHLGMGLREMRARLGRGV